MDSGNSEERTVGHWWYELLDAFIRTGNYPTEEEAYEAALSRDANGCSNCRMIAVGRWVPSVVAEPWETQKKFTVHRDKNGKILSVEAFRL